MRPYSAACRGWWICAVVFGAWAHVCLPHGASAVEQGAWTRTARTGGETWVYRFTVLTGTGTNGPGSTDAPSGGEARLSAEHGSGASTSLASARRLPAVSAADNGGAAADVDIAVERAYAKTATGGNGGEVAAPAVGQTVYFYVDFSLTGTTGVYIISRRAVFDGEDFCHTTETTSAGSYFAWCPNGWTATAGDHTLRWDFDYNNQLTETDETNNSASTSWTSAPLGDVDIVAERAYLKTMSGGAGSEVTAPVVGQAVYFYLDFSLVGPGGAVAVDRRAVIDGQTFCDFSGAPTPGAYLTWCNDAWTATAGQHTLRWDLDYSNTAGETNENNNSASTTFTSTPPGSVDLEAQRAYLRTMPGGNGDEVATPSVGQTVYFYLDFRVISSGDAIAEDRQATLDGQPYCSFTGTAPPGDYYAWCNDGWTATAGSHTLQWDLDFNHALAETNENNNSVSTTFTSGTGACGGDCNGDGAVTVNELITMVNIALGTHPVSACSAGDANADGEITVNEIVAGVNHALSGCG